MEEATIEDEPELEQTDRSSRPETSTGLLPWSYILQIGISSYSLVGTSLHLLTFDSSQPTMGGLPHHFTGTSYFSLRQCSSTTNDHIQSGNNGQAISRKSTNKRD
jgi:hypothetical protein